MDGIQFFGKVDRRKDGKIASTYPADYFTVHRENLKEDIDRKERAFARGEIPPSEVEYAKMELARQKTRLKEIDEAVPKYTDQEKDLLAREHKNLGAEIRDSMFSYDDMNKGFASAHEEAHRMKDPIIKLNKAQLEIAKACEIPVQHGMVCRDDAARMYKIIGKRLGENTNIEALRKIRTMGPRKEA